MANRPVIIGGEYDEFAIQLKTEVSTCPKCHGVTIDLIFYDSAGSPLQVVRGYPRSGPFSPAPPEVPSLIAADYSEANEVLLVSPKASAALSRRCLQSVLSDHGYKGRDLAKQVESVLTETDAARALPLAIRDNIDAIRNFGNFSAHPITDQTTFQIIDVDENEAEWCLQLLLDMFEHYYVSPARAAERRASLGSKLLAAGKPAMKT